MQKKYQSEQLMVIHDMVKSLYKIGAIDDTKMREFDADCLISASKTSVSETSAPETARKAAEAPEPGHPATA
jgi:DNA-binding transcriptional regulator YiaG